MEQGVSPSWPRQAREPHLSHSPQDWKEKYIHENYTKALAGKMVEMVRTGGPLGTKLLDSHPAPAAGGGTDSRGTKPADPGGEKAPFYAVALLGVREWTVGWAPSSCWHFPAGVCRGLGVPDASSLT